jgi:hypothetical protein
LKSFLADVSSALIRLVMGIILPRVGTLYHRDNRDILRR